MEKAIFKIKGERLGMKLLDVCEFIVDCPHSTAPDEGKGYPLIRTPNIGRGRLKLDNVHRVSKDVYDKRNKRAVPQVDDIIFAREAPAGNAAIICDGQEVCLGQRTVLIRPDKNKVYPQYLVYYILAPQQQYELLGTANGATVAHVNIPVIKNLSIQLPEMDKQIKIANTISSYDDLIENNQKQIKLLEEAAQRLYKEWFIDLRFPGHEDVAIVDGVPEEWKKEPLSKVFTYVRGKSYTSKELVENGGTLMVNLKNIRAFGGYNRNAEKRYSGKYKEEQKLNPGDLVMGVTDMTQERRLVGYVAIIPDIGETMTFSMDLIKLIPLSIQKSFLYATMYFGGYSKKISPLANGVNVLHLKPEAMMNMEMLIPTKEVMDQYDVIFDTYQKKIETLQKQCDFAAEARDRLLPKLMSGEIEV